jgi:hypothetical protein
MTFPHQQTSAPTSPAKDSQGTVSQASAGFPSQTPDSQGPVSLASEADSHVMVSVASDLSHPFASDSQGIVSLTSAAIELDKSNSRGLGSLTSASVQAVGPGSAWSTVPNETFKAYQQPTFQGPTWADEEDWEDTGMVIEVTISRISWTLIVQSPRPYVLRVTSSRSMSTRKIVQHLHSTRVNWPDNIILSIYRPARAAESYVELLKPTYAGAVWQSNQQSPFPFQIASAPRQTHEPSEEFKSWLAAGATIHLRLSISQQDKAAILARQQVVRGRKGVIGQPSKKFPPRHPRSRKVPLPPMNPPQDTWLMTNSH